MSTDRRIPRGPTSEQLRRRVLAYERLPSPLAAMPWPAPTSSDARRCTYCGALSPQGCQNGPCSFHR